MEEKTLTRYIATILLGDKYHKEGEEHIVSEYNIDKIKGEGLRIIVKEDRYKTVWHLYPVSLKKCVYRLEPISEEPIEGGDRDYQNRYSNKIGYDWREEEYDWREHWP